MNELGASLRQTVDVQAIIAAETKIIICSQHLRIVAIRTRLANQLPACAGQCHEKLAIRVEKRINGVNQMQDDEMHGSYVGGSNASSVKTRFNAAVVQNVLVCE